MDINDIISFDTKEEFVILDKINYNNNEYLYCVGLVNGELMENYIFLKLNKYNNKEKLEVVIDEKELDDIIGLFTDNYLNKN